MRVATGEGQTWNVLGETVTCKATGESTGGAYSLFEVISPPHGGAPLHIHHQEDESFYLLDGDLLVQAGEETLKATIGSFVQFPRGMVHTYKNNGTRPAKLLVIVSPGGYEKFFEAVPQVPVPTDGPPDMAQVMEVARRFNLEVVGPPLTN
jgi:quercetin dioxygenase-like cupin family protein